MAVAITEQTLNVDLSKADFINAEYVNNEIRLLSKAKINNITYYVKSGQAILETIDLGVFFQKINKVNVITYIPSGTARRVYTSTSTDGKNFEDFVLLNPDSTISSSQGRYIKIKIELSSPEVLSAILRNDFVPNERFQFVSNELIDFNGFLSFKTSFETSMNKSTSWMDVGQLFSHKLNKQQFKKFDRLGVK